MLRVYIMRGNSAQNDPHMHRFAELSLDMQVGGIRLHDNTTPGGLKLPTAADKAKLDGIASNATANQSDLYLLNRDNHTGTQAIGTITGLQTTLDGKIESSLIGINNGIAPLNASGLIDPGYVPAPSWASITGKPTTAAGYGLTNLFISGSIATGNESEPDLCQALKMKRGVL